LADIGESYAVTVVGGKRRESVVRGSGVGKNAERGGEFVTHGDTIREITWTQDRSTMGRMRMRGEKWQETRDGRIAVCSPEDIIIFMWWFGANDGRIVDPGR